MHTFTFSSNDRLPDSPFKKIWLLIFISLVLFIVVWDGFWISRKIGPLPKDDAKLWSYHRKRVVSLGKKAVVLIGSSRMQMGLDQGKFTQLTGKKTIQLAVAGESPIPVLQNLAEDDSFNGTIISDFSEYLIYERETNSNSTHVVDEWVKEYKESKSSDDLEFMLRGYGRYVLANPTLGKNLPDSLGNLITGKVFSNRSPQQIVHETKQSYFDRTLIFDLDYLLSKKEIDAMLEVNKNGSIKTLRDFFTNTPPNRKQFLEIVNKIETFVQQIQSRGGKVIFVSFPMSGELEKLNDVVFPREVYWDVFAAKTSATTIHYKDYLQLQLSVRTTRI